MDLPEWLNKEYIEEALRVYHKDVTLFISDFSIKPALGKASMDLPEWLNKEYIEEALRVYHKDVTLFISDFSIKPALGKGENFGGLLTKVKVTYHFKLQQYTKNFIVKSSIFENDEFAKSKMQSYDIFNREISIYEQVLPHLQKLLYEIKDEDKLFAEVLHVDYKRQALIFEDLSAQGYVMANRVELLDRPHTDLILRKLAKMHATSVVFNKQEGGTLEIYDKGFFNRYTKSYASYFVGNLLFCANMLKEWPEYVDYAEKLQKLEHHYMDIGIECFKPIPGHINVLCHGDMWTNNVMFKYENEKPIDVIIIDFQYSCWGSPALDLHHFFNTSLKEHIRQQQLDVLYLNYYKIFTQTLCKLNYKCNDIPSLQQFLLQVEQKRFFAFHSSCIIQPVMINENCKDADFNALMSEDERGKRFKCNIYKNPIVQQNIRHLIPIFDKRGILEINQCD